MPNNFAKTIANVDLRSKALRSFKDEYLLDFVNIEDPDETDERVIEQQIVHNIKNFIMALGSDFSFMGNQYRLVVSEKDYFIYLLLFNRRHCLLDDIERTLPLLLQQIVDHGIKSPARSQLWAAYGGAERLEDACGCTEVATAIAPLTVLIGDGVRKVADRNPSVSIRLSCCQDDGSICRPSPHCHWE